MGDAPASDLVRGLLEHRDGLFGFILALTRDREAAEEVFQEVGVAIVEEAKRGTRVARFLPWAHEVIRRRVAEHFRKRSRRTAVEHSESLDEAVAQAFEENAGIAAAASPRRDHLEDCLEHLSPVQRRMIEGRYRERQPIRLIARGVDWSETSVKSALWKARRQLARCIEGKMGGED
jgi:RNA polymerase sigma-70 factor (ECF subfamily)